ncbi:MAG: MFS transporter, partial [Candidatus Hodarchaeales archaeon]
VLSFPLGSWSDKTGRKNVFAIGLLLFIITCIVFVFANDLLTIMLVFALYGAFNAATDGIQKAYTVDLVPSDLKGTGLGLIQTTTGFATIAAGIIAGMLMGIDPPLAFIYGGLMATIALILLLVTKMEVVDRNTVKNGN